MLFLQYQLETTRTNSATGIPVQTIEGVVSVRDISWEEDSDNITVTTDTQVYITIMLFQFPDLKIIIIWLISGPSLPSGDMFRELHMWRVYSGRLVPSVWLVYSGEQVFSEVTVQRQLSGLQMGTELQRMYLHHCVSLPVHSGLPVNCT